MNLYSVVPLVESWQDYGRVYVRAESAEQAEKFARDLLGRYASVDGFYVELLEGE